MGEDGILAVRGIAIGLVLAIAMWGSLTAIGVWVAAIVLPG
jgi:hypothetical protein